MSSSRVAPPASHWVKDIEFESVMAVWASVLALKITHTQLVVWCIYATAVFGKEGSAFTLLTNIEQQVCGVANGPSTFPLFGKEESQSALPSSTIMLKML